MLTPCERIMKCFLPSLKAGIAHELYEQHDMNQVAIAKKLRITQAAVSKYLSKGVRRGKETAAVQAQISAVAKRLADSIANSHLSEKELVAQICEECLKINGACGCALHRARAAK